MPGRVAVLGNNGAGKSTFFLCCNGSSRPSAGDIYLDSERLGSKNPDCSRLRGRWPGLQDLDTQIIAGTVEADQLLAP